MSERKRVIITAGGTKEKIDDVRFITNFSTGRFGHAIARCADQLNYAVTLITSSEANPQLPKNIEQIPFTDTESLKNTLLSIGKADVVSHAAAVSDYRPRLKVEGKIASTEDKLVIEMEKTPKILPLLRDYFGNDSYLVGFKLLSRVTRPTLIQVAQDQTINSKLDLTVANDLQDLKGDFHPVTLVPRLGKAFDLTGDRLLVAERLMYYVDGQVSYFQK